MSEVYFCCHPNLIKQAVIVVVASVNKRHSFSEHVIVCENKFHRGLISSRRTCPAPYLPPVGGSADQCAKVSVLGVKQIDCGVIIHTHLTIDRVIPTETRLFEVSIITAVNTCHTGRSICRLNIVRHFRGMQRLSIYVREDSEAQLRAAVWNMLSALLEFVSLYKYSHGQRG